MASINQMCHAHSSDSMPKAMTSDQFETLIKLECKYHIKIDWTFEPFMHVASDKISAILTAIRAGQVKERPNPKDYDLHNHYVTYSLLCYQDEEPEYCDDCGSYPCNCHLRNGSEEDED